MKGDGFLQETFATSGKGQMHPKQSDRVFGCNKEARDIGQPADNRVATWPHPRDNGLSEAN